MTRLFLFLSLLVFSSHGDNTNKPIAIPFYEREGHNYKIAIDNLGEKLNFSTIALYATHSSGLFAEFDEKTGCAEFFTPTTYEKKCADDGMFFLIHGDHYKYVKFQLKKYLKDREKVCKNPVKYRDTLLILDKPDRVIRGKPKHVGNFIERDNTISYYLNGNPVVIELVTKKLDQDLLPYDRFEILCKLQK